ncbi:MAG: 50S ribosomal protein L11 methyltransferase, partial [Gallionellaceae bacterium]|nr:50S ribosomal protein L11 methyltransferase [Gallionellaceae bacterium]
MGWVVLTVTTDTQHADNLSDVLLELGALSVDIHDADANTPAEQAVFGEPGEPAPHLWLHNRITALFAEEASLDKIMLQAAQSLGWQQPPYYSIEHLADHDWVRLTQAQFHPIRISPRLWIVPTWHTPSDPSAINITLDPGLAFGTGS